MAWTNLLWLVAGGIIGAVMQYFLNVFMERRRRRSADKGGDFKRICRLMPKLLEEMAADLKQSPLWRDIVILESPGFGFVTLRNCFMYYQTKHPDVFQMMAILQNSGYVARIKPERNAECYRMSEEFAGLLLTQLSTNRD